jgi:hypothetical protein
MSKLDLNKLEEKLDVSLDSETTESLNDWLKEKRMTQQTEVSIDFKEKIFENVEWVFQFDYDEPILLGEPLEDAKELVFRIGNNNNSNIWFYDGKGKTLKIFAREKK